jgi:DNA-binding CsgD family transcriptional regulator
VESQRGAGVKNDAVAIIEAAYDLKGNDQEWLDRLARTVRPSLERGQGIVAYFFDASGTLLETSGFMGIDADPMHVEAARLSNSLPFQRSNAAMNATYRAPSALRYASAALGPTRFRKFRSVVRPLMRSPYPDVVVLNATDVSHTGCILAAPALQPSSQALSRTDYWARLATHVAAGLRLRRTLMSAARPTSSTEAVLSADGAILHASGPASGLDAQCALRNAALAADRARGRLRQSAPEAAPELWSDLVAGRWSLVDHFDTDGRRFVVAHRNDVRRNRFLSLTQRERQVLSHAALAHSNKRIAYDLGLSISAVGTYLTSAAAKLGLRSRAELVRLSSSLGAAVSDSGRDRS